MSFVVSVFQACDHPAVWLCGRMLRREAEQACDDLVVCATGRSEAYAHGLAHIAERAAHLNPLISRIPTMNAFAAESDLALRIRRTLGGSARRMGTPARVLATVLLCPLAAVTLPSCSTTSKVSKVAAEPSRGEHFSIVVEQMRIWQQAMATDPDQWSDELKAQLRTHLPDSTLEEMAEEARKRRLWQKNLPIIVEGDRFWRQAMATDPDEWSDELKAQLRTHLPDSTLEEMAEEARKRRLWREAVETYPADWSDELKAQLRALKPANLSYEIIATPASAEFELAIYNVLGQHVRTVALGYQSPGKYRIVWDGRDDAGRELSSGVYFYELKTDPEEAMHNHRAGRTLLVK